MPHSRRLTVLPQIRYDINLGDGFSVAGAAVYENQYTSRAMDVGVYGSPNQAQRNGVMPELVLCAEYKNKGLTIGAGAEVKRIKPRMTVTVNEDTPEEMTFKADEFLTSSGFMAYLKHKSDKFTVTAKGYYGQNMTHLTFLGGYGVAKRNEITGEETYTNYKNYTTLLNMVYGKKWQAGLMLGYGGNLGTCDSLYPDPETGKAITAGILPNVQDMYRVAPHVALNVSKFRLVAEYEMTTANYGTGAFDFSDGLYADKHETTNNRIELMMMYFF